MWHKNNNKFFLPNCFFSRFNVVFVTACLHELPPQDGVINRWHEGSVPSQSKARSIPKAKTDLPSADVSGAQPGCHQQLSAWWSRQMFGRVVGERLLLIACHSSTLIACFWVASSEHLLVHASRNQGVSSFCTTKVWMIRQTSWFHDRDPSSRF